MWYGSFTKSLTSIPSTRPSRNIIMATIDLGLCWPEAGESSKSGTFRPFFDVSPFGQEGDWSALTYTGKGRFSMVQAVTYQSDKQSVYFQGKLIVLENLTPVLSPEEKRSGKEKSKITCTIYSASTGTGFANQSQHCCPGLLMV